MPQTIPSLYDALKHNPMFAGLDHYEFGVVEHYLTFRALDAGETLFYEGERGDYMAVVVAGNLDVFKKVRPPVNSQNLHRNQDSEPVETDDKANPNQQDNLVHIVSLKAGESTGEMSVIDEMSRSATVMASERTGLIILPKADFDRILQDHPRIGIDILKGIAQILSIHLRRTSADLSEKRQ